MKNAPAISYQANSFMGKTIPPPRKAAIVRLFLKAYLRIKPNQIEQTKYQFKLPNSMEKKYFFIKNNESLGPFTLQELEAQKVLPDMMFWYDGLDGWKHGYTIKELESLFTPSVIQNTEFSQNPSMNPTNSTNIQNPPKKMNKKALWLVGGGFIGIMFLFLIFNSDESSISNNSYDNSTWLFTNTGSENVAQNLANGFVHTMMEYWSPKTGNSPSYILNSWTYNNKIYTLDITGLWYSQCALSQSPCQVSYDFRVQIHEEELSPTYSVYGKNDCAVNEEICNKTIDIGIGLGKDILEKKLREALSN